jgi:hypothetical protein
MVGGIVNIRNTVFSITVFTFFLFFTFPYSAHPNEAGTNLEYNNGFVSIRKSDIPCIKFLIDLSELANLQLIVVETIDPNRLITVNFNHESIEEVVRSVLDGYSYAVIYNTSEKDQGLLSYKAEKVKTNSDDFGSGLPLDAKETKRQMLIQKIEELNRRIKSGESDRFYSRWAKVRDPKFVVHDRDKLESYQRQLGR